MTILFGILAWIHHEVLIFAAVGLAIGGLDDLLVDIIFFSRRLWRSMTIYTRHPRMTTGTLPPSSQPGRIAIFIPAWREAEVIGPMLTLALGRWGEEDYRVFVGIYPNDPDTLQAITAVASDQPRVIVGINDRDGPTTKADCLNVLWRAMLREEKRGIM